MFFHKVNIISDENEVEACMGPGGIFGNIRGANKYLTMSNVVASRNIDVLSIEGRDFYRLLKVSHLTWRLCGPNFIFVTKNKAQSHSHDSIIIKSNFFQSYPSVLRKVTQSVYSTATDYVIPTMSSAMNSLEVYYNKILIFTYKLQPVNSNASQI